MPLLVSRTVSLKLLRGYSSEYRKKLDRKRTITITYATFAGFTAAVHHCCFTGVWTWQRD